MTEAPTRGPAVELRSASKVYGGTIALQDVSIQIWPGEIHALVGENGAGKSTLTKLLCGAEQPDSGELRIDGEVTRLRNPLEGQRAGVTVIYQEPRVFPDLTVAENIFLGQVPKRGPLGLLGIDRRTMRQQAQKLLAGLGTDLDPDRPVSSLSVAELQLVEIAAALTRSVKLLVVDEPTASLTPAEVEHLGVVLRRLSDEGVAVLFIGHRLDEILALSSRITVLRDGRLISSGPRSGFDEPLLIREMVGRHTELFARVRGEEARLGDVALAVEGLTRHGFFQDISFEARAGEILALAGLVGSGRTEVIRGLLGIDPIDSGRVLVKGQEERISGPRVARQHGICCVPEDRQRQGAATEFSITENLTLPRLGQMGRFGIIARGREFGEAVQWIDRLKIKATSPDQLVGDLSGGNQQKLVIAKWLACLPDVLILDEPTRGVDVGAKAAIHELVVEFVAQGGAVVLISSDLPEVLALADRILVLRSGRVAGELPGSAGPDDVMGLAVGSENGAAA